VAKDEKIRIGHIKNSQGKNMSVEQTVIDIIAEQLGIDKIDIKLDSKLKDDLGADELDVVEIVAKLQKSFSTEIPNLDWDITVDDIVKALSWDTDLKISRPSSQLNNNFELSNERYQDKINEISFCPPKKWRIERESETEYSLLSDEVFKDIVPWIGIKFVSFEGYLEDFVNYFLTDITYYSGHSELTNLKRYNFTTDSGIPGIKIVCHLKITSGGIHNMEKTFGKVEQSQRQELSSGVRQNIYFFEVSHNKKMMVLCGTSINYEDIFDEQFDSCIRTLKLERRNAIQKKPGLLRRLLYNLIFGAIDKAEER
jgi:acyl carrier protein